MSLASPQLSAIVASREVIGPVSFPTVTVNAKLTRLGQRTRLSAAGTHPTTITHDRTRIADRLPTDSRQSSRSQGSPDTLFYTQGPEINYYIALGARHTFLENHAVAMSGTRPAGSDGHLRATTLGPTTVGPSSTALAPTYHDCRPYRAAHIAEDHTSYTERAAVIGPASMRRHACRSIREQRHRAPTVRPSLRHRHFSGACSAHPDIPSSACVGAGRQARGHASAPPRRRCPRPPLRRTAWLTVRLRLNAAENRAAAVRSEASTAVCCVRTTMVSVCRRL